MNKEIDKSSLLKKLKKEKVKNKNILNKKNKLIKDIQNDIKKIKIKDKYLSKTIEILNSETIKSVSYIHKKESTNKYIKARFYWNKKQREIQIGSIEKVLSMIKKRPMENSKFKSIDLTQSLSWDSFSKDKYILEFLDIIATRKIKRYIAAKLDHIIHKETDLIELSNIIPTMNKNLSDNPTKKTDSNKSFNKDWYSSWRNNN